MDDKAIQQLLQDVAAGRTAPEAAARRLRKLPYADLDWAKIDHHRRLRHGVAEAVYGPGKTPEQCAAIVEELLSEPAGGPVLLTRATEEQVNAVLAKAPDGRRSGPTSAGVTVSWRHAAKRSEDALVVTAGTSDLPVAEECRATLAALGFDPLLITDVGVAGIHRVLAQSDRLADADAVVVVAGMEGALASVVGGLTGAPIVAVPTSTGYGASLAGITALLGMLSSCAEGLVVVGIDNGFGAARAVARILGPAEKPSAER